MSQLEVLYQKDLSTHCTYKGVDVSTHINTLSPTELFAVSLGSCTLTIMGLAAKQLGVELTKATAFVTKEMSKSLPRRIGFLAVKVICEDSFSRDICEKLEEAGKKCPIHQSLHPDVEVQFEFVWGDE